MTFLKSIFGSEVMERNKAREIKPRGPCTMPLIQRIIICLGEAGSLDRGIREGECLRYTK